MTADPLFNALARFGPFKQVPPEALRDSLPLWQTAQLKAGRMLWKQGRPADSLGLIHAGGLEVMVNGTVIDQVKAPAMVGETAIFITGSQRIATLRASATTVVLVLASGGLRKLRERESPLYSAILEHALVSTQRRCQLLDRQISQLRQGNFAAPPPKEQDHFFSRLWHRLRPLPEPDPSGCPPLDGLLARQPVLADQPAIRAALVPSFTAQHFRQGETIAREGEHDPRAFVLAAGRVDALRTVEERGAALLLARFEPGSIFGVQALVDDGERTASLVATTDGWLYHIDRAAHDRMAPQIRTAWLEAMLAVLTAQCQNAGHALHSALAAFATRNEDAMPSLIINPRLDSALGSLEGHGPGDSIVGLRVARPDPRRRR